MSLRANSNLKLKRSVSKNKRKVEITKDSSSKSSQIQTKLHSFKKKLGKDFNSSNSSKKIPSRKSSIKCSNSPLNFFINSQKPSESSFTSLDKLSIFECTSEENTVESPAFKNRAKSSLDHSEIQNQLKNYKKKNQELQSKLEKLKKNQSLSSNKIKQSRQVSPSFSDMDQDSNFENSAFKLRNSNFLIDFDREFSQDKAKRIKKRYQEKINMMKNQFEKVYREEMNEIELRHEAKLKNKIAEVVGDCDRKVDRTANENLWLKKQNEKLKSLVEDLNSKLEISKKSARGGAFDDVSNEQNRKYNEIFKQYLQLQQDYFKVKDNGSGLCQMCKALTQTNSKINSKISRIREYIGNENN